MRNPISGIYEIVNVRNGKRYIGSATYLSVRKSSHLCCLRKGEHGNKHLQKAFDKYGEESFEFRVIIRCDPSMLLWYEQRCLDFMKPEYNIAPLATGGNSGTLGEAQKKAISETQKNRIRKPASEETKKRMSESLKGHGLGRHLSEETKQKISEKLKGRKMSPESIEKSASKRRGMKGHPMSPDLKKKLLEMNTGRKHTEEAKRKIGDYWTGRKRSDEQKLQMSISAKKNGEFRSVVISNRKNDLFSVGNLCIGVHHEKRTRDGLFGIKNPASKVTENEVHEIRRLHNDTNLTYDQIIEKLGLNISKSQVGRILSGKAWAKLAEVENIYCEEVFNGQIK